MKHFAVIAALFFILPLVAYAGTTGCLSGTITDDAGMPVANALVTATSPAQVVTTRTDARGWFRIVSLAPGSYTITSERVGYNAVSIRSVAVSADNRAVISLHQPRALTMISCDGCTRRFSRTTGGGQGETADVYRYNSGWSQYSVPPQGRNSLLLRLTPGVTSGPGSVIPH
jgi:hypothetical protein